MFNPAPRIQTVTIHGRYVCHVIDDVLFDPDAMAGYAARHMGGFSEAGHNGYPGPELRMPDGFSAQLDAFFVAHLRRAFDVRRTERMHSRLAIATTPPERLRPSQSICHIDRLSVEPRHRIVVSVLYPFRDVHLGGTSFYGPNHPPDIILAMIADANALDRDAFRERYGIDTAYMTTSNAWFTKEAADRVGALQPHHFLRRHRVPQRRVRASGTVVRGSACGAALPQRVFHLSAQSRAGLSGPGMGK